MKVPANYADWCTLFDEIASGPKDEEYLDVISKGTISWTSGVAERFVKIAADMIEKRINKAQDVYQRQMKNARGVSNNISTALLTLRKEYRYVYSLAAVLPIPEDYRNQLTKMVQDHADTTQQSLEDSAKADRTGHLTTLVKNAHMNRLA